MRHPVGVQRGLCLLLAVGIAASIAAAQPVINDPPVNQASFIPFGFPQHGIARGAMFAVFGSEMGPEDLVIVQQFPLTTELADTSVQVTVNGVTVDCFMIFTLAGQLAAVLPSNTPLGQGTITVAFNGQRSEPAEILVVESAIGIFAIRQDGHGPGVVTDVNFRPNSLTDTFTQGQIVIAWVTGLGARSSDTQPPMVPEDLKGRLDLHVLVGGQEAKVFSAAPSGCCAGVDQVAFEIPPAAPTGCFVPLVMWTGEWRSNYASISIAPDGSTCSDDQGFLANEIDRLNAQGSIVAGTIALTAVFVSAAAAGDAPALLAETSPVLQTEPQPFAFATFGHTTPFGYSRVGTPFATNTCAAFWTVSSITDNPFAALPLPARGDLEVEFPMDDFSVVVGEATGFISPVDISNVAGNLFEVTDTDGDLSVDGQPAPIPSGLQHGTDLFFEAFEEGLGPIAEVENWLGTWDQYYANGGEPPRSFNLQGLGPLPPGTVLELSGQATFGPADSLIAGYFCNVVAASQNGEYLIGPEVMVNFPSEGPFTGLQGVRLFPLEPSRILTSSGPVDTWLAFDQLQWQRQYAAPLLIETFATTATGNQVVPPTGSLFSANCTFAGAETGVSGICAHNMPAVTGVSMNLGPLGENGTELFFITPDPGARIDFGVSAGELDPATPIGDVLDALRNGLAYVLLHSAAFPDGEIRGQIEPDQP